MQVMTQLIGLMTDAKYAKTVVVFAGYDEDMRHLINSNQGIASRIPARNWWHLPDWAPEDCCKLLVSKLREDKFHATDTTPVVSADGETALPRVLDDDVRERVLEHFRELSNIKLHPNFGNGAFFFLCAVVSRVVFALISRQPLT